MSFYITTPIYYVNDKPHIGHAYTTLLADVLARYQRLLGEATHFLTGTDEHGQKVADAAAAKGLSPQEQCDQTVVNFVDLWARLEITNDDFIRTTESRHTTIVQQILQDLYDRGEIYKDEYVGWYCKGCEIFCTEKDLEDGNCPNCGREVKRIVEENYFFKMSKYQDWLIEYINENPTFIQPDFRRNETLGFLRKPLNDLCISRPKSRLSWGIELPFDADFVTYVWFDALVNYISAIGYGSDPDRFGKWWPASYHLIGKDILTTHTVYWPTMLKAMGVEMPKTIFAHGWWLMKRDPAAEIVATTKETGEDGSAKIGKSLGNAVDPMKLCDTYGIDAFRYYLMAEMTLGQDASFSEDGFIDRFNNDLAGNIGNMLNRVVKMTQKQFEDGLPTPGALEAADETLKQEVLAAVPVVAQSINDMRLDRGLEAVIAVVKACNRYFEDTAPWALAKAGNRERLATVMYNGAEALRIVSGLLYPVMPAKMTDMRRALGVPEADLVPNLAGLGEWGLLQPGASLLDVQSLFPRIEKPKAEPPVPKPKKQKAQKMQAEQSAPAPDGVSYIEFTDFTKVDLRTAKIVVAEPIKGADKLLRLEVEVGAEKRQILAGIAKSFAPEALIGKTVVIVANLQPRKMRGLLSEGMLLAAGDGDALRLVTVDGEIETGCRVG